jgi:hypothetical protein
MLFAIIPNIYCSFSSTWKKTNQKKTPVSRSLYEAALRVVAEAGARGNSPACGKPSADSNKSARFYPAPSSMLGAGQWETYRSFCNPALVVHQGFPDSLFSQAGINCSFRLQ